MENGEEKTEKGKKTEASVGGVGWGGHVGDKAKRTETGRCNLMCHTVMLK